MSSPLPEIKRTFEELKRWKVVSLKEFCKIYQVNSSNKTKNKLTAFAYSVQVVGLKPWLSGAQAIMQSKKEYQNLLHVGKTEIPDPFNI